jgi:tRNA-splicing ligase RtcB
MEVQRIGPAKWRIPRCGKMRTDGIVYASAEMMETLRSREQEALQQVANVAHLPGIVGPSIAMPDIHWGYGFPIGGVAAFAEPDGVVSPGGIGFDINCGVRLLRTDLTGEDLKPVARNLADSLYASIPSGVGSHRRDLKLSRAELRQVLEKGAAWAVSRGLGRTEDLDHIEERGCLPGADPEAVTERAVERGRDQLGTLGSGNHFCEVQVVDEIYDEAAARAIGLDLGTVTITIHTGSRGLGYQTCEDYLRTMLDASRKYGIELPDKQLCCAPLTSSEGKTYLSAMSAAANYAFCNRQVITHYVREAMEQAFHRGSEELGLSVVYDVCHNIAKLEEHEVDGRSRRVCVHRKGATRAFPAGHPLVPPLYREIGQPVLVPGDMGRYSFVLLGTAGALRETFGSSCHGAGRVMSRHAAAKSARGRHVPREMAEHGIELRAASRRTVVEEISEAYKDVATVVDVVEDAGIGRKVARLRPRIVVKG